MRQLRKSLTHVTALTMMLGLTLAPSAGAEVISCSAGDIDCLISAINEANSNDRQPYTIRLAAGIYTLTNIDNDTNGPNGLPSITGSVKIVTVNSDQATLARATGAPNFRLLHVAATGHLILRGVIVTNGNSSGQGGGLLNSGGSVTIAQSEFTGNRAGSGGGLVNSGGVMIIKNSSVASNSATTGGGMINSGTLTVARSTFDSNTALGTGALVTSDGVVSISRSRIVNNRANFLVGGFHVTGGTVSIESTSLVGNSADGGGAIRVEAQGTLAVTKSAFIENRLASGGSGAAITSVGMVEITNTTFANNVVAHTTPGVGIAIYNAGTLRLTNSTFAGNTVTTPDPRVRYVLLSATMATTALLNTILVHDVDRPFHQDCGGPVTSLGGNLIGDPTGCAVALQASDLTGDPGLGVFTDDGTPANGHFSLLPTSQAIDAGIDAECPRKDQLRRPRTGQCDIGAIGFRTNDSQQFEDDDD
jgi:hypothetical protein